MGMFDEVQIDYPLPWPEVQGVVWQSKDTPDQHCTRYGVDDHGRFREQLGVAMIELCRYHGAIECYASYEGCWYSVTFWIREGVVKDTIFRKRNIRSEP